MASIGLGFDLSLLNIMLTICICSHILELVHERHLQNKLVDLDLGQLPFTYISCYAILNRLA
jgi:hypothetical protein